MGIKLKKSELVPKSRLGIDPTMKICWNCLFWNPTSGRCPMFKDKTSKGPWDGFDYAHFPYNHNCGNPRWFGNMTDETRMYLRQTKKGTT